MTDAIIAQLDAIELESWEADLDLREQAQRDPYIARLVADADAQYLARFGRPWVNPLAAPVVRDPDSWAAVAKAGR